MYLTFGNHKLLDKISKQNFFISVVLFTYIIAHKPNVIIAMQLISKQNKIK